MTQDIGTAVQRVKDHPDNNSMVYTVGNEQDYNFIVLFLIHFCCFMYILLPQTTDNAIAHVKAK